MAVQYGVGLLPEPSSAEVVALAKLSEELGYDQLWIPNERLCRDVFVTLTLCAVHTSRVRLGTAVLNPYTHHLALLTVAAATVDEVSGGRLTLGMGAGGTSPAVLGITRQSPASAIREAASVIRGLLREEKPREYRGNLVQMAAAALDFTPVRRQIPLHIAARGPKILSLAGEVGDGAIIGGFVTPQALAWCRGLIEAGARKAGRDLASFETVAWIYTSISDDSDLARQVVKRLVALSVIASGPIVDQVGLEVNGKLRDYLDQQKWTLRPDVIAGAIPLLSEQLIDQLSIAGTPTECAARLRPLLATGVNQVAILPFTTPRDSKADIIRRFRTEVVPRV